MRRVRFLSDFAGWENMVKENQHSLVGYSDNEHIHTEIFDLFGCMLDRRSSVRSTICHQYTNLSLTEYIRISRGVPRCTENNSGEERNNLSCVSFGETTFLLSSTVICSTSSGTLLSFESVNLGAGNFCQL